MENLEQLFVNPKDTIRQALAIIDQNAMQIALVIDESQRLIGTLTDGDVRRGVLRGLSLEDSVALVMNKNPVFAHDYDSRDEILTKMTKKQLRHLPVVDSDKKVLRLEILNEYLHPREKDNYVVLMAGGLGKRLGPLTEDCPKPLLKVQNKPILENIILNFVEHGFRNFYISVNYKAEMIEEYFGNGESRGIRIEYLKEKDKLGTAGALSLLPRTLEKPVFVMNGDLLTKVNVNNLLDFHTSQKADMTMCVREYDFEVPFGVIKTSGNRITSIDEKPIQKVFVNAGIYILSPSVLKKIPANVAIDMPDVVNSLINEKKKVSAFPLREYWLDIGRRADLELANQQNFEEVE